MNKNLLYIICTAMVVALAGQSRAGRLPAWSHTEADDSTAAGKSPVASIVDAVIWVVGDEAIRQSDGEGARS